MEKRWILERSEESGIVSNLSFVRIGYEVKPDSDVTPRSFLTVWTDKELSAKDKKKIYQKLMLVWSSDKINSDAARKKRQEFFRGFESEIFCAAYEDELLAEITKRLNTYMKEAQDGQ